jgi:hypothetical protein
MFNMKFHADERSMDMTRRRRWHRKMVPSAEENFSGAAGGVAVNTDVVFRMQSQVTAVTDSTTTAEQQQHSDSPPATTNKEVKIELNAPRMYLSFKSKILI